MKSPSLSPASWPRWVRAFAFGAVFCACTAAVARPLPAYSASYACNCLFLPEFALLAGLTST